MKLLAPFIGTLLVLSPLVAAASPQPAASLDAFAREFVAAVRSGKPAAQAALLHPRSSACLNDRSRDYFDWIFERRSRHSIPPNYQLSVTPLDTVPQVPDGRAEFPVRPTHSVQLDYASGTFSTGSMVLLVAEADGRWAEVLPCPAEDAIAGAAAARSARDSQDAQARQVVTTMDAGLRKEVLGLLAEGRKLDAVRRITATTGVELVIAKRAVEMLQQPNP